jgi:hypothetical protein
MLEGCLILLVVLIIIGAWLISVIPWWFVGLIISCAWIVGWLTEDDEY